MSIDPELERFKTEINLSEYAASRGYQIVKQETSRNSAAMKHPKTGDKIIIARAMDNHYVFFSIHRNGQYASGSILDFVMGLDGRSLGEARMLLRSYMGLAPDRRPPRRAYVEKIEPSTKDRQGILKQMLSMQAVSEHPYLASRAVEKEILSQSRFQGRVYIDERRNAVFPHEDSQGICGYEIKNRDFTGFSSGGEKGLWRSNIEPSDQKLVFCESAIDAISHAALFPDERTRYMSTGGGWSEKTRDLIKRAAEKLPGNEIVLAFDNDPAGRAYEAEARALLSDTGKTITTHYPSKGKDWNDQLQALAKQRNAPAARPDPIPATRTKERDGRER